MTYVTVDSLRNATKELLEKWKVPKEQSEIISDTIVYAHTHEKHTHGITRLPIYEKKIKNNLMSCNTAPEKITETVSMTVFDCHDGFGQIAAYTAMKKSMDKAKESGIGISFVRNSNNFGVAGYFGEIAANENMVGIVLTSSGPAVAPPGGTKSIFGTNPICCAFPSQEGNIVLDMAISEAARGKIRLAEKNGEKIPFGWAVDENGNPTDEPAKALKGNMLAIGGIKGFGLAMSIDIMAGLLSGSAFGGSIKPLAAADGPSRHGHVLIAIDITKLMSLEEYYIKIETLIKAVKDCGEPGEIYMPGEKSGKNALKNKEKFELKEKQIDDFNQLAVQFGISNRLERTC
jgi:L-2-hydroxycarboxylate dehydrogenase (NAD+)